ncbi:hypothetical protein M4I32_09970 [Microbacterium sp. LRZ72]|uniref:hypothetical protein n=1 Tax=Microbacterium sp. LRZ72 TaxID=2942481 RepID=UPI0029BF4928|nr:hypothetical protein [Microbacterium sp. LRZ72]MDX2377125.1 hypothetical protein [Microbacterium sp. LRZ72]
MLVNPIRHPRAARARRDPRHTDDTGSTLVSVLIVMLVLSIVALTAGAVVTGTAGSIVDTRGSVQSKAAADAGLSAAVADARRTGEFCDLSLASTDPAYTVTGTCAADRVTFTSVGRGTDGGVTTTEAVYAYTLAPTFDGAAELVFFNSGSDSVYFTNHVMPRSDGLATVEFPAGGSFECKTTVPANVNIAGSVIGQSGCTINGDVHAGGENPFNGRWAVYLNNSDIVQGDVTAGGDVAIGNSPSRIDGTLTLPQGAKLQVGWMDVGAPTSSPRVAGGQAGGIRWESPGTAPSLAPTFEPWFDYAYAAEDWPGYDVVTITSSSAPYNCGNIAGKFTTFWSSFVANLTVDTVVDTTACAGGIDTARGADAKTQLGVDLVLVANSFTLGDFALTPKAGTDPNAWFIVPDRTADAQPTCTSGSTIETDASIDVRVNTMAYTPCTIRVGQGGVWTGAMYAGTLTDGGDIDIHTHSMALPGQWGAGPGGSGSDAGGAATLGDLLSQRDLS